MPRSATVSPKRLTTPAISTAAGAGLMSVESAALISFAARRRVHLNGHRHALAQALVRVRDDDAQAVHQFGPRSVVSTDLGVNSARGETKPISP